MGKDKDKTIARARARGYMWTRTKGVHLGHFLSPSLQRLSQENQGLTHRPVGKPDNETGMG